jgi:bifunctional UDP-N-acetylglucosamine pyrophosphorylase/glucosamine-1-phosphate N-acetyltransferase
MTCDSLVLAAGLGTRMHSALPKVLHRVGGRTLLAWVEAACRQATGRAPYVVLGPEIPESGEVLPDDVTRVEQSERKGTGHAVLQAAGLLRGRSEFILIATADMPLLRAETLRSLVSMQADNQGPFSMLTLHSTDSRGFGRVVRDDSGKVMAVIEESLATADQLELDELNAGVYCFRSAWLWDHLPELAPSPSGEIYLTDLVALAAQEGTPAVATPVADSDEVIGINNRIHLAEAEAALRRRINDEWMLAGVTLVDPATTYIEPTVVLASDILVLPGTHLLGATSIGRASVIGPNTVIADTTVGEACRVKSSILEGSTVGDEVHIGPFAHLRPGARLGRGVHMGNFGEVKNSVLGDGVKMGHFSYVGDAEIGEETNIGAGTITCNFGRDGRKNRTWIGERVFIGSDTLLVAPVRIGDRATTGAGSVVTKDVPQGSLAVGMPARVVRKGVDGD